jgi:site-specific recombinase XerC
VFLARGGRISARHVQRRFKEWLEKAGIRRKVGVHGLRHSFAERVYSKTHDLLVTKQALRHRSVASTLVYAHTDEGRVREALCV